MHLRKVIIATFALIISAIWIWMGDSLPIQPFCPFHKITGVPCPGCGGVRATKLLLSGDFKMALYTNPLSVLVCITIPFLFIGIWIDYIKGTNKIETFLKKRWNTTTTIFIILIILLNWIWNIQKGL